MVTFLVVRFAPLEDLLLATPVFRHLKEQVEDARVLFLTGEEHPGLFEANPHIDRILLYSGKFKSCLKDLREEGIDYIIDLQRNAFTSRLKFRLRRMDFTVSRNPGSSRMDANLECIRHFIEKKDGLGPELHLPAGRKFDISSLPESIRDEILVMTIDQTASDKK